MANSADDFIESLVAATLSGEIQWTAGNDALGEVLEEAFGNYQDLYTFSDEEAGANVALVTYQYYDGEVEAEEFIKDGASILLVDNEDFEILNELTDEDVTDATIFETLLAAIKVK